MMGEKAAERSVAVARAVGHATMSLRDDPSSHLNACDTSVEIVEERDVVKLAARF